MLERTVLIVEDDGELRESVAEILSSEGIAAVEAENGLQALRLLRGDRLSPDVILLDLMMPVMSGWQFLKEQHADPSISSIPVVVMSAVEARDVSAAAVVQKPFEIDALLSAISSACRAPAQPTSPAPTISR